VSSFSCIKILCVGGVFLPLFFGIGFGVFGLELTLLVVGKTVFVASPPLSGF
jgi:hypothetical protein